MRQFIVSDLHGNDKVYYSIVNYLNNVDNNGNVTLYINGDLIDRGFGSGEMLFDVYKRITNNIGFKIEYIAGNHELMMYNASKRLKYNKSFYSLDDVWLDYGGNVTAVTLEDLVTFDEQMVICDYLSTLNVYHKFDETINGKNIVLSHSMCPREVKDNCDLKVKDTISYYFDAGYYHDQVYSLEDLVFLYTWARVDDPYFNQVVRRLGNDKYFSIVGHTPNFDKPGFKYDSQDNVLNIDGGSARDVGRLDCYYEEDNYNPDLDWRTLSWDSVEERHRSKIARYDHVPLVEILDNKLRILIFNRLNQIIDGYYFINQNIIKIDEDELNEYRKYLEENKLKKLTKV